MRHLLSSMAWRVFMCTRRIFLYPRWPGGCSCALGGSSCILDGLAGVHVYSEDLPVSSMAWRMFMCTRRISLYPRWPGGCSCALGASSCTALNISTGPLALHTFQTAGPVRASTLYLSLALQDHRVKCRASRLKITVARSMTNFATFSCILFLKFRYVCIA